MSRFRHVLTAEAIETRRMVAAIETQVYLASLASVVGGNAPDDAVPLYSIRPFLHRGVPVCRTFDRVADRRSTCTQTTVAASDERPMPIRLRQTPTTCRVADAPHRHRLVGHT